jgi:hypothetical protein
MGTTHPCPILAFAAGATRTKISASGSARRFLDDLADTSYDTYFNADRRCF